MNTTMTVGAFEAKTKFSELLDQVSKGMEVIITKHERPVAKLVPIDRPSRLEFAELFHKMEDFREHHPLNPVGLEVISYRDLIDEGRKR